ncbi:MASE1 domain-containing protein [Oleiharenicola lentus]|uniref:MASE1 domain-containing protein n=1 Tax=Oleiharenicola lentus TaxID=2508720 RepID=UPI003F669F16
MQTPRALPFWISLWISLAVVYCLIGRFCITFSEVVENVSWMPFIPAGLALTCALLLGKRVWPGVFFGELALVLWGGESIFPTALLMATGNALECALAGWWFHDRIGRRIEFDNVQDVVGLLIAELVLLQPLSAAIGTTALALNDRVPADQIWSTATAWYAANLFAVVLIAPITLSWIRWKKPAQSRREWAELTVLAVLTCLVGAFAAGRWATYGVPLTLTLIFILPLLVWAAVRFVPSIALSVGSVLALLAFDAVLNGHGNFQGIPIGDRMFYLNVFMGVCIGTALFLAAAMGQQKRFEAKQAQLILELQAAVGQVKRLEDFVTFCAWTGRVRWRDQWVSVETFLRERYSVSISHGISEEAIDLVMKTMKGSNPPFPEPSPGSREHDT